MDCYRVTKGNGRSYLCICAFTGWLPIFNYCTRYFQIVADSLRFCRSKKGLLLRGYVFMVDHLHLIVAHDDISGFMRDFKTWTSRQISAALEEEGRQDALQIIRRAALALGDQQASVWQTGFHPKGIMSDAMMLQKLQYVHHNPVRKGFVPVPEAWWYSSAGAYLVGKHRPVEIDPVAPLSV